MTEVRLLPTGWPGVAGVGLARLLETQEQCTAEGGGQRHSRRKQTLRTTQTKSELQVGSHRKLGGQL